jgi:hypothetical protein
MTIKKKMNNLMIKNQNAKKRKITKVMRNNKQIQVLMKMNQIIMNRNKKKRNKMKNLKNKKRKNAKKIKIKIRMKQIMLKLIKKKNMIEVC